MNVKIEQAIDFQMKVLKMVQDDDTLKFENRLLLQGYLNCALALDAITQEEFTSLRDEADTVFNLGEFLVKRLNAQFKDVLGVDISELLASGGRA